MPNTINSSPVTGSLRVHTRASQPRTSSNSSFQEHFRSGMRTGVDVTNNAVRHIVRPIPGAAALSAPLSEAALSLDSANRLGGSPRGTGPSGSSPEGDINSLQDEMVRSNEDMLKTQWSISQITSIFNTKSNVIKAFFDALKNIGANIR